MKVLLALLLLACSTMANSVDKDISKFTKVFDLPRNGDGVVIMNEENYETVLKTQLEENIGDDGKHKKLIVSLFTR